MKISSESEYDNFSYESNGKKMNVDITDILNLRPKAELCMDHQIELLEQLDASINDLYMESGNKDLYDIRIYLSMIKHKLKEIK